MLATITDSIEYYDGKLTVKFKPIFEHLRLIKAERMLSENLYRTLETRSTKAKEGFCKTQDIINQIVDYRTRKTIINTKKEPHIETQFINGASNRLNFEPVVNYIVKFTHLCLHEEETIEQVKEFLINCNNF